MDLPAAVLVDLVSSVRVACSADHTRPHIEGVLLIVQSGMVRVVGTNGHWLLTLVACDTGSTGSIEVLLPSRLVALITSASPEGTARIGVDGPRIAVQVGAVALSCLMTESAFPKWEEVIPQGHPVSFKVKASELATAVGAVLVVSEDRSPGVSLTMDGGTIQIRCDAVERESETTVESLEDSQDLRADRIGFCGGYLVSALRSLGGEVEVRAHGSLDPWRLQNERGTAAVMPMRI